MKNKRILILIVLLFVLLIGGATVLYRQLGQTVAPDRLAVQESQNGAAEPSDTAEESEVPKVMAPDFTVYDDQGSEIHLSDYIGKPIVLNFWASWCGPCQMEMPAFHEKYLELEGEVRFLMINMTGGRETMESAMSFIQESGYTFPVFYDTDAHAASVYGAYSLPMTFFIDAEGYAVAQATGAIDGETLQKGIDMIL